MRSNKIGSAIAGLVALTVLLQANTASACAVCYGKSDSALTQGMNMGILTLLVVVGFVLAAIAGFGFYLARRAAHYNPPTDLSDSENL